jgi:hypothetical protein
MALNLCNNHFFNMSRQNPVPAGCVIWPPGSVIQDYGSLYIRIRKQYLRIHNTTLLEFMIQIKKFKHGDGLLPLGLS